VTEPASLDARELFASLARHGVHYLTVGGIALHAHGGQRLTTDLDIAVAFSSENLQRLATCLAEIDARVLGPGGERSDTAPSAGLLGSSDQWHLITRYGALDIVTVPAHLGSFEEMRARAHEVHLDDVIVPIANRQDLLEMKRATSRLQDLADVEFLESIEED
jgi:hypothetical protein